MEKANSNGSVVEHNVMSQLPWDRDAIGYLDLKNATSVLPAGSSVAVV
jgi:hypothetical protein